MNACEDTVNSVAAHPMISVITPVHNSIPYLKECVNSVFAQTNPDFEMILVDDGSTDGSAELIRKLSGEDHRIQTVFLEESVGPARARNEGLRRATGRFIAFLDSDDMWAADKLEKQISYMRENGHALSYTAYSRIREDGSFSGTVHVPRCVDYHGLLHSNVIGMLTAIYDREKLGLRFLPDMLKRQDYALWLSILREGHTAYGLNEPLALYRVRGSSVSRNKFLAARYQWRVYRELEQLPLLKSCWYFAHYAVNGIRKNRI